jgi:hypothetical protein
MTVLSDRGPLGEALPSRAGTGGEPPGPDHVHLFSIQALHADENSMDTAVDAPRKRVRPSAVAVAVALALLARLSHAD